MRVRGAFLDNPKAVDKIWYNALKLKLFEIGIRELCKCSYKTF